jgi:4-carboxymuconolactone decarboxylase
MKLLAATAMSLALTAPAIAQEPTIEIARSGSQPSRQGPAENFTGSVRVDPLFAANGPSRASGAYVTFEAGARSAWHTHPLGQTLIVTAGSGRVQSWGGPIQEIRPGDVVRIPPGLKHWHGASPDSAMTHIAIQEHIDGKTVDWLEKVSDAHYGQPPAEAAAGASAPAQPTRAQKLFGDITPKLAELTDNVLFGDVWARPGLSRRDRSLATVSALVAMNRPDQLRSHLALARENGVTKEELVEAITHLAFYAGWPNAINAALVAKEVLP